MNLNRHFPITSARYEIEDLVESIGQQFSTEIIPMGKISVMSGQLAIGDPLLGMSSGSNPWLPVSPGSYSIALTRLVCLDKNNLEIPAYLSIILDPDELEKRRQQQSYAAQSGSAATLARENLSYVWVSDSGKIEEIDDTEVSLDEHENLILTRSGVVCMVDAAAFQNRMPNPLLADGGWFTKYFDAQSQDSWVKVLDDTNHIDGGVANIALPQGPDDWTDNQTPTIALAQMTGPGTCLVFIEYASDDFRKLNPIAVHVEMGLHASMQTLDLKTAL